MADDPPSSFLEEEFVEVRQLELLGSPPPYFFTDTTGNEDFWYRVQTCDDNHCAPPGPPIPGHGNSSFCKLRAGVGWLSCVQPSSVTEDDLYDAEHGATQFVMEEYLRPKYALTDLLRQFREPLPQVRFVTEALAAMRIVGQYRPDDENQMKALQEFYDRAARGLAKAKTVLANDLVEKQTTQTDPGSLRLNWGR